VAAGAGASIALACDHRVASDKAKLVLSFINAGLIPDSGAIWFLARMIGTARAYHYAATAEPIDAETGKALGLFDEVTDLESFERSWRDLAARLATGPTEAYAIAKELVHAAAEGSLSDQLELEVDAQTRAGKTADHQEGVRAFLEKRRPNFQGR
jgi:2-(1,2-epoxy-1,2-dihydrophenyl)acetyl-CoA isomerase